MVQSGRRRPAVPRTESGTIVRNDLHPGSSLLYRYSPKRDIRRVTHLTPPEFYQKRTALFMYKDA